MRKLTEEEKERLVVDKVVNSKHKPLFKAQEWDEVWETGYGHFLVISYNIQNLYKGYIKEEWKPKYKELVLMSDDNMRWHPALFRSMKFDDFEDGVFDSEMNFTEGDCWRYCKPYKYDN